MNHESVMQLSPPLSKSAETTVVYSTASVGIVWASGMLVVAAAKKTIQTAS
ncbi:hypothetical protein JQK88_07785 [Mesorhizobium caraganae]|uniref:hypothetical protein n=1 Tax=Mesorhizobium caraganae TaxID=483206 RepID=UPI00193A6AA7|nr:hypothetical protein [Mesorhizobium caraganae]MBM2711150.1 hypothetical protein [Mesorhizobium caraganae]